MKEPSSSRAVMFRNTFCHVDHQSALSLTEWVTKKILRGDLRIDVGLKNRT